MIALFVAISSFLRAILRHHTAPAVAFPAAIEQEKAIAFTVLVVAIVATCLVGTVSLLIDGYRSQHGKKSRGSGGRYGLLRLAEDVFIGCAVSSVMENLALLAQTAIAEQAIRAETTTMAVVGTLLSMLMLAAWGACAYGGYSQIKESLGYYVNGLRFERMLMKIRSS